MPTIPKIQVLTNSSVDILNAIRNDATVNYQNHVKLATPDAASIKAIGAIIMDNPMLMNEFVDALVNRIGRVIVTSKSYTNPLAMFKKGMMEMGETIEEVFVEIAKPFQYDPEGAYATLFKQEKPNIKSAFHIMNFQKFYKTTVREDDLRKAFLSWNGVIDLITKITESMYTAEQYDEFQVIKYMIGKHILKGQLYPVTIPAVTKANMGDIVTEIKSTSNDMEFMKKKYNLAGVRNHAFKSEQYLLVSTKFDASMDVNVLASAFNMDKVEFLAHRVSIDSFGEVDTDRLAELFADDTTYKAFTTDELTALDTVPAVLLSGDWFMIFDNLFRIKQTENGEGLYWNYAYHTWKTFSVSPFAPNALFIPATPAVTSVSVSPSIASVTAGQKVLFSATVVTTNFASQAVNWSINSELSTIDSAGNLTVGADETANTITVTATSVFDPTKTDTSTVTVV